MIKFKPELYPNSKTGKEPDVEVIIQDPKDWIYSLKRDGGRLELCFDAAYNRSMKRNPSEHIQRMWKDVQLILQAPEHVVIEAEFYSPNMTFGEIMHFFKCADVTSDKERKKLELEWSKTNGGTTTYTKTKDGEPYEQAWEFPGRDVDWLCTWHPCLKFYAFNLMSTAFPDVPKIKRTNTLERGIHRYTNKVGIDEAEVVFVDQNDFEHVDELYQAFDQAKLDNLEGLVVMRKDCVYKQGRHSATYKDTFKLKDDNLEFDGVILSVEEGTQAKEGTEKTINELGRSRTSQLKEDREPSGIAKGFKVRMEDGNELTVSLKGYDHPDRRKLLITAEEYVGKWIRFTGMAPVKEGGCPRHAHFEKGNFRDEK